MAYDAHIRVRADGSYQHQSVREHCRNTAAYAASALSRVHLSSSGYLAGLLHDAGKNTMQFAEYLGAALEGKPLRRGSVNHTFCAVRMILERWHRNPEEMSFIVSEILAIACGAHHGLFDCVDEKRKSGFAHRMNADIPYEEASGAFLAECAAEAELDERFRMAVAEMTPVLEKIIDLPGDDDDGNECSYYSGLLARLILSAVIEGDRRDTAEFMRGSSFPPSPARDELQALFAECLQNTEEYLGRFPCDTPIARARSRISELCKEAAADRPGIFRLNVPTGAGKTISSLRFALSHALANEKRRIIFTSPLLSILDQNARVIRDCVRHDDLILEHHSNVVDPPDSEECLDQRELLTDTWDSPIIITTLVQLLDTLFSGKTACIRRFHALCDSIIVIDEVQTVPAKMLSLFTLAVNFLAEICGATIVLCSATQPCMEAIPHPLKAAREIVAYDEALWAPFKRTNILPSGRKSLEEIASFTLEQFGLHNHVLVICNKKAEVEALYTLLKDHGFPCYALTAAMCVRHRRQRLKEIDDALANRDMPCLCLATQVIEAGVDVSFDCVIRLAAGMDSVVQAAGRCNRGGEAGEGIHAPVYVVEAQGETLRHLDDIVRGKAATLELLEEYKVDPEKYVCLDSDRSISYYYRSLYRNFKKGHMDFHIEKLGNSLFSLLSQNEKCSCADGENHFFRQAFRTAGAWFFVFDNAAQDMIVPYQMGAEIQLALNALDPSLHASKIEQLLIEARPYTVSLFDYQLKKLKDEGAIYQLPCGAWALIGHYQEETGFTIEDDVLSFMEV